MVDYATELAVCCKQLRISGDLAERALSTEGESHLDFLLNLLRDEVTARREARIAKLIKTAGFPRLHSFEEFRPDQVEFNDTSLEELKQLQFYHEGKNLIMYGGTGTGKTMLSICIGLQACREGYTVRFFRTARLINKLSEAQAKGRLDYFLNKLSKVQILILEEFGYVPYDRNGSQLLFDYLCEQHEDSDKVIILNTNLEFSQWVNVLYSEKMAAALIGRLTHHCHLMLFPGENNRLKESSINELYRSIALRNERESKPS